MKKTTTTLRLREEHKNSKKETKYNSTTLYRDIYSDLLDKFNLNKDLSRYY